MKKIISLVAVAFVLMGFSNVWAGDAFDLNGDWIANIEMKTASGNRPFNLMYKIVQKNMEIKMIAISGKENLGTLKGNIIHLEPVVNFNSERKKFSFPARQYKISQDGNTMTSEFGYTWEKGDQKGAGTMKVIMMRE